MKKLILTFTCLLLSFNLLFALAPVSTAFTPASSPAGLHKDKLDGTNTGTPDSKNKAAARNGAMHNIYRRVRAKASAVAILSTPAFSYSGPQIFTQGTAISLVSPVNSGDPVSAPAYTNAGIISLAFTNPYGIAVDASGNVFVADYGSGKVLKFTGGSGSPATIASGFNGPKGLTIDHSGNLYVADAGNNAIKKIPAGGGTVVTVGPSFNSPVGLAFDAAGNLYVTDNFTNAVYKLPAGGGSAITLARGFGNPQGLVVDASGNLFVCDVNTGLIKVPAGGRGNKIVYGTGLTEPAGIAIDGSGNLFVTDASSLYKIPAGGTSHTVVANGVFNSAYGVAVDSSDKLYLTDNGNNLLAGISPKGGYYISPAIPAGLSFSNTTGVISGKPTMSSAATNYTVTAYNASGSSQAGINVSVASSLPSISYTSPKTCYVDNATTPLTPTSGGVAAVAYRTAPLPVGNGFFKPYAVAVDAAGNLYVADTYNSQVEKLPANGGAQVTIGTGISYPTSVAADAAGNVYITEQSGLYMIPAGGGSLVPVGSGFTDPTGVAIDAVGNIYIADYGNNAIKKIPIGGGTPVVLGSGFSNPSGVAVDAAGNVYVADSGNNVIKKIPAAGGSPVTLGSGFIGPVGVAVDAEGNVFVADGGNNAVKKIPAAGGAPSTLGSGFNAPNGVAVDAAGNVFVADYGNNAVKVIAPIGGYFIDTMLPAGLSLSNSTGIMSGTPAHVSSLTTYTISAYNINGFAQAKLKLQVLPSTNANLSSLRLSAAPLSPAFSSATTAYSATVPNSVSSLKVTPTTGVAVSTVAVNGVAVASGTASTPISLNLGANTINIMVTAQDGVTTKTYTITVTRLTLSNNASLSAVKLNKGTITPAFSPATYSYTVAVANAVTSITVTPTTADPGATVTVNGTTVNSGSPSLPISLKVGSNVITVFVTAQDGTTTQTYTFTVNRPGSNNDDLIALLPSQGVLSPAFVSSTSTYADSVANSVSSISITPTASDPDANIKVNGTSVASGAASTAIVLSVGLNTIGITVTASNGIASKAYVINVIRAPSSNANLTSFKIRRGALTPTFSTNTANYTASVVNGVTSMTVTPTTADATATVTVNGTAVTSGSTSGAIALGVGANTISTVVTAQDGTTTKTYTLTVSRAAGPVASYDAGTSIPQLAKTLASVDDGIVVHQGLSPNGDGVNDHLTIENITNYPDNKLSIMNRNGQLIFEAKGYDNSSKVFDGRSNKTGQMQLPGTYFYRLDYTIGGIVKHKTGYLVLKY